MESEYHPALRGHCIILDGLLYRLTGELVCIGGEMLPICQNLTHRQSMAYPVMINLYEKMFDSDSRISILENVL